MDCLCRQHFLTTYSFPSPQDLAFAGKRSFLSSHHWLLPACPTGPLCPQTSCALPRLQAAAHAVPSACTVLLDVLHSAKVDPECAIVSVTALPASPPCPSLRGALLSRAHTAPDPPLAYAVHDSSRPLVCGKRDRGQQLPFCEPPQAPKTVRGPLSVGLQTPASQVTQLLRHRTTAFSLCSAGI